MFSQDEYRWRYQRTRRWLAEQGYDGLVAYSYRSAITAYWTGYCPRHSVTNASLLVLLPQRALHVTRVPIHKATASGHGAPPGLEQVCATARPGAIATPREMAAAAADWLGLSGRTVRLAFAAYAPEAAVQPLLAGAIPAQWEDATAALHALISARSDEQIARVREAGRVAQLAFDAGLRAMQPGCRQVEPVAAVEAVLRDAGATDWVCFAGATNPRGETLMYPRDARLERGAVVLFEVIPDLFLFCPEVVATVYVGEMPAGAAPVDALVRDTLARAVGRLHAATTTREVANMMLEDLVAGGVEPSQLTRLGHGTGLDNIEYPEHFADPDDVPLGHNRVISIHPNASVPGVGTILRGGTLVVTDSGAEPLFRFPSGPLVAG